jgi:8-amino-7-oxononanoate synthase
VYSTDGSLAPLKEISELAEKYGAKLIVDEAHAVGILGPQGKGLVVKQELTQKVFALVIPFGKALGAFGAIVLGDKSLMETLVNFALPGIYSTALPFQCLAAIKCSYDVFPTLEPQRKHLHTLIETASFSQTPIQPIPAAGNRVAKQKAASLFARGFDVGALLSPTVQRGNEILRICLHAFNSQKELTELIDRVRVL